MIPGGGNISSLSEAQFLRLQSAREPAENYQLIGKGNWVWLYVAFVQWEVERNKDERKECDPNNNKSSNVFPTSSKY